MDMTAIKDEIQLKLTGDVLDIELSDSSLTKIVNSSLREIQRYIDTVAIVTIPFSRCIDLSELNISSVIGVRRSEGFMVDTEEANGGVMDPMYASQWQILSGLGNVRNLSNYAYNYASWNTILQIKNTTSTDLAFQYDKLSNKLYVSISSNLPETITVLYVPRFDDVSQITSDFWIDVLIRHAVAQTKIVVGRVRTKFKQSNPLWVLDGDTLLEEGKTELTALREELKASTQLVYGID
jgi:hypothetical protein